MFNCCSRRRGVDKAQVLPTSHVGMRRLSQNISNGTRYLYLGIRIILFYPFNLSTQKRHTGGDWPITGKGVTWVLQTASLSANEFSTKKPKIWDEMKSHSLFKHSMGPLKTWLKEIWSRQERDARTANRCSYRKLVYVSPEAWQIMAREVLSYLVTKHKQHLIF